MPYCSSSSLPWSVRDSSSAASVPQVFRNCFGKIPPTPAPHAITNLIVTAHQLSSLLRVHLECVVQVSLPKCHHPCQYREEIAAGHLLQGVSTCQITEWSFLLLHPIDRKRILIHSHFFPVVLSNLMFCGAPSCFEQLLICCAVIMQFDNKCGTLQP